jgi:predicted helicase
MPRIFPSANEKNVAICTSGTGARDFSVLVIDSLPSYDNIEKGQCFPLYLYDTAEEEAEGSNAELFEAQASAPTRQRRDAITAEGLQHFQSAYPGEAIGKEDIFYYVYGLLHSPDYRERYSDNLSKELPRIPCVKTAVDFWAFSKAGRQLAELHLNYETVAPYAAKVEGDAPNLPAAAYRVEKMKHGKGDGKASGKDKDLTVIHYNARITVRGVPLEAYDYIVNGKSAIAWVMERQAMKTDKDSGITNDANDWATETMGNPRYPLELLLRVITVSLETLKIVQALPQLDIADGGKQ